MKTFFCVSVSLIGLLASVATASAVDQNTARVTASRALCLASVNTMDDSAPWYILQEAFVSSISTSLADKKNNGMQVNVVNCDGADAAARLLKGDCDAVLVIGEELPYVLKSGKFVALKAVSQIGTPARVFQFVLRNEGRAAQSTLAIAFEHATASPAFQRSIGRISAMRVVASNLER
jgi:ABC-type taurine transport system substrate-binding protein